MAATVVGTGCAGNEIEVSVMFRSITVVFVLIGAALGASVPTYADDFADCRSGSSFNVRQEACDRIRLSCVQAKDEDRISVCTKTIDFSNTVPNPPPYLAVYTQYNTRGTGYDHLRQYDNAIADYTRALDGMSGSSDLLYEMTVIDRAHAYANIGSYEKAIADWDVVIRIDEADYAEDLKKGKAREVALSRLRMDRALLFLKTQSYNSAIIDFGRVIELCDRPKPDCDSNYPKDAFEGRGSAYAGLGNYDKAVADWKRAGLVAPTPEQFNAGVRTASRFRWLTAGEKLFDTYVCAGIDVGAAATSDRIIAACSNLINHVPGNSFQYHWSRGKAYLENGDYDHAIADFTPIIDSPATYSVQALWPPSVNLVRQDRAVAYFAKGDIGRALSELTIVVDFLAKLPDAASNYPYIVAYAYGNRAEVLTAAKDYAASVADSDKALAWMAKPFNVNDVTSFCQPAPPPWRKMGCIGGAVNAAMIAWLNEGRAVAAAALAGTAAGTTATGGQAQ
jgi:tetratricopeptide (TPR) repeat protein